MLDGIAELARELAPATAPAGPSVHAATVVRVDEEGVAWVAIPGGARETPCAAVLADVRPGDSVQVSIDGNRATVTGNASRPSTDDSAAIAASDKAVEASATAQQAAEDAATAALAAARAVMSADEAAEGAAEAGRQAGMARSSAEKAGTYAYAALAGLSDIEKVVDAVEWISEHGEFLPTRDVTVIPGKVYYEPVPGGAYSAVVEPDEEGLEGYYELSIDEGVSAYVARHLALMEDGLHIVGRDSGEAGTGDYQGVFTPTGVDFVDPMGRSTSHYGETSRVGLADGLHLELAPSQLGFLNGSERLAYFGLDADGLWNLMIENAYVRQRMRFGDYAFSNRANGNMTLRYVGDDD